MIIHIHICHTLISVFISFSSYTSHNLNNTQMGNEKMHLIYCLSLVLICTKILVE